MPFCGEAACFTMVVSNLLYKVRFVMKAIIAWLMSTTIMHAADVYLGLGGTSATESFRVENPGVGARTSQTLFNGAFVKVGYGDIDAFAVEARIGYGRYDQNVFSVEDSDFLSFDVTLLKAFDFDWGIYPYGKIGFGTGELEVRRTIHRSRSSGSFFAGGGFFIPILDDFDAEFSMTYRSRNWQDIDMIGTQVKSNSHRIEPYLGINYRF